MLQLVSEPFDLSADTVPAGPSPTIDAASCLPTLGAGAVSIAFDGCFGWFHPGRTSRGVVLCSPVGEEADYVYPSWRELAERLAKAGLSVIRFDYPGLYNSLDLVEARDPPAAWVESIKAAINWLKVQAGVEDVVLVGLRFGAGLALKCAEELGGLGRLVLMAPVVSGVSYQRELALLAKLSEEGTASADGEAPHQAATLFTAERTFDVRSLRCGQGGQKPATKILILSDAVSGLVKTLGERLRALGSDVADQPFQGYAELMVRPELARYPEVAFGMVLEWLREDASSAHDDPHPVARQLAKPSAELFPRGAHEVAIHFGDKNPMFGIQCLPHAPSKGRPGIVFLNTSAVPLGGMNRMWVSMARRLAVLGFTSLRFDIHGVGDSSRDPKKALMAPQIDDACIDVAAAISQLETLGCSTITVIGFCWGSQLAFNAALADDRITNLVMINARRNFWGPATDDGALQTFGTHLRLLRDSTKWKSLQSGKISLQDTVEFVQNLILAGIKAGHGRLAGADTIRSKTINKFHALKARGAKILLVHGNEDTFLAEFEDYFGRSRGLFGILLRIHTRFFPGVSHRFPDERSLSEMIEVVAEHLLAFSGVVMPRPMVNGSARPV